LCFDIEHPRADYEWREKQSCGELLRRAGPTWPGILLHGEGEAVCKGDYQRPSDGNQLPKQLVRLPQCVYPGRWLAFANRPTGQTGTRGETAVQRWVGVGVGLGLGVGVLGLGLA
jgi:hypothetical protein